MSFDLFSNVLETFGLRKASDANTFKQDTTTKEITTMDSSLVRRLYYTNTFKRVPMLKLIVNGVLTEFIVDTGAYYSCLSRKTVQRIGLSDKIYRGSAGNLLVDASYRFSRFSRSKCYTSFIVIEANHDLWGYHHLAKFNSIINLDPVRPTLTLRPDEKEKKSEKKSEVTSKEKKKKEKRIFSDIILAGEKYNAMIDTGNNQFFSGSFEKMKQLTLTDLSKPKGVNLGLGGVFTFTQIAENVSLSAFGKTVEGTVKPSASGRFVVGM